MTVDGSVRPVSRERVSRVVASGVSWCGPAGALTLEGP